MNARTSEPQVAQSVWKMLDPPILEEQLPTVRRDLLGMIATSFGAGLILMASRLLAFRHANGYPSSGWIIDTFWGLAYAGLVMGVLLRPRDGVLLLRVSVLVVVLEACFGVLRLVFGVDPRGASLLVGVQVAHAAGALLLPWTPLRALLAASGAFVVTMVGVIAVPPAYLGRFGFLAVGALVVIPGLAISILRNWRDQAREMVEFFRTRYLEVRQELVDARLIHEAAFPPTRDSGAVRFSYAYEPMRQIGGDYLHAHVCPGQNGPEEALSIAILDVTGHGIPAALTVNRLHGELVRLYAENPYMAPGAALRALNRYVFLTLSDHSVFVTGIVFRVDPTTSTLEFASAGHPPAFLQSSAGVIEELGATSIVLGALDPTEYEPAPVQRRFMPGDSIIAYTDGAMDTRSRTGERLEVAGLRRIVEGGLGDKSQRWPESIMRAIHQFRHGPSADDVLIVEAYRIPVPAHLDTAGSPATRAAALQTGVGESGERVG
ncbi:MAG: SpoIIE family protein phosphatase [Phycisphaerales bacterium]|nr:SpoIIE family protein phosphatase [Phycisphaerales bacterium]